MGRCPEWVAGVELDSPLHTDGALVFEQACRLGLEGIVSKHKRSLYRSGRTEFWVKLKNPEAPAVRRETEEDWTDRRSSRTSRP